MATIATPPARRTVNTFAARRVYFEAGEAGALVHCLDSGGALVRELTIEIRANFARGIAYGADGSVEKVTITDPANAATNPAAAFAAFVGAAGGYPVKAAAFEAWCQTVGLLPS